MLCDSVTHAFTFPQQQLLEAVKRCMEQIRGLSVAFPCFRNGFQGLNQFLPPLIAFQYRDAVTPLNTYLAGISGQAEWIHALISVLTFQ